jgi:adenine-specific DNA-methyltransferase
VPTPKAVKKTEKKDAAKSVEALTHKEDKRKNIPTAEFQPLMRAEEQTPLQVAYERRNKDLDPQLVWRGKDLKDWSDLVVSAPAIYIQEKVHPKVLIDDLRRRSESATKAEDDQLGLFADFNGVPAGEAKTEFYQHDANWTNRMILGDSLQVMASLAEREGLRGKVQCIYIDPPYGIRFNSNFQWSTTSRDVRDTNVHHITREPEQVKAFRDTWQDGVHSYLTYLRDRLTVARELLADSGSIFVQIGDENAHRVRALLDEVFGSENIVSVITLKKTAGQDERLLNNVADYIIWFARAKTAMKFRDSLTVRSLTFQDLGQYSRIQLVEGDRRTMTREDFSMKGDLEAVGRPFRLVIATSSGHGGNTPYPIAFEGHTFLPTANRHWSTHVKGFQRLIAANRILSSGGTLAYVRFFDDFIAQNANNIWTDVGTTTEKKYVVETGPAVIQRCMLMATDPGDLVLDPTCGSGTTAYVAEQWGRRWITIDTSRVALALARARIMGARYSYYLLADSRDGQLKEAEATRRAPSEQPTYGNIRQGFVYERVPHITLKSIAHNAEIDVIWEKFQTELEPLREKLNAALKQKWQEWEIPRETDDKWPQTAKEIHAGWCRLRIARQKRNRRFHRRQGGVRISLRQALRR